MREFAAPRHLFALRGAGCLLTSLIAAALAEGFEARVREGRG